MGWSGHIITFLLKRLFLVDLFSGRIHYGVVAYYRKAFCVPKMFKLIFGKDFEVKNFRCLQKKNEYLGGVGEGLLSKGFLCLRFVG